MDYSWAPSKLKGRKSTVQEIVQEEEEEEITQEHNEEEREENTKEEMVEGKKTLRKLSSLDSTVSSPSFYEPPVNLSWEEQQEGKDYGKTTEEILKMIEDEDDEAPEDRTEDVINLDSDEDEEENHAADVAKPTEKQVVTTKVLFSSFGRRDNNEYDDPIETENEAMGTAEVVEISDEEEDNDVAPPSSVVEEGEKDTQFRPGEEYEDRI